MKKSLLALSVAFLAIVACQKEEKATPQVTLSTPSEVSVANEGGTVAVTFNSTVAWTASVSSDASSWATLNKASGEAGDQTIKVSFLKNGDDDNRTLDLKITAETASATVKFTQLQANALSLKTEEGTIESAGGELSFVVLANIPYKVSTDADWISVQTTKGAVESTVTLQVEANPATEERSAEVYVDGEGKSCTFTLTQEAAIEPYITLSSDMFEVDANGGDCEVTVESNVDYTIDWLAKYDHSWASYKVGSNGTISIHVDKGGLDGRYCYIDLKDPNSKTSAEICIHQTGTKIITYSTTLSGSFSALSGGNKYRLALQDNYLIVSSGICTEYLNAADGSYVTLVDLAATSIASDDAGNMIIATTEAGEGETQLIFAFDGNSTTLLASTVNQVYGSPIGNIRVKGDVKHNAVITALACTYHYWYAWEIKDGVVQEAVCENISSVPDDTYIWDPNYGCVAPLGPSLSDGLIYTGYTAPDYNSFDYCSDPATNNWTTLFHTGSNSNVNSNAFSTLTLNGRTYVAMSRGAFFSYGDCPEVEVYDITDINNATLLCTVSRDEFMNDDSAFIAANSGAQNDVILSSEGNNLVVYAIDGGYETLVRVVIPL